ncbi:hypothetical protein A3D03_01255 [Candidatus Gottesmanbacteria bacterium RIFCSPHIGHO2_02_FULL_40_13]|uniref:Uncharacterized protein n=1 Tax=Candidatus Gottesmanbacteria bacterium RIFCSPHIGHO2_02_FULL_40_13 TaxID=1798384 RepID=A0A1F6A6A8_9BACT|nr:MAG: hypothetical protein A3D03_01255 [Candidatus Gottesmanbacteria bacterium RIFCSPHIGHO2_02_FULL_40_13]
MFIYFLSSLLAQATDPIGKITPPGNLPILFDPGDPTKLTGLISLINTLLRVTFIVAGLWAFLNIILAGFGFLSAGGDDKKIAKSWAQMWQSLIGLLFIVSSFIIAAIIGIVLFNDPSAILVPKIVITPTP